METSFQKLFQNALSFPFSSILIGKGMADKKGNVLFFLIFMAALAAYGSSQDRD